MITSVSPLKCQYSKMWCDVKSDVVINPYLIRATQHQWGKVSQTNRLHMNYVLTIYIDYAYMHTLICEIQHT